MSLRTGHHPGGTACPRRVPSLSFDTVLLSQAAGRAGARRSRGGSRGSPGTVAAQILVASSERCAGSTSSSASHCWLQQPLPGLHSELPLTCCPQGCPPSSDVSVAIEDLCFPFGSLFSPSFGSKLLRSAHPTGNVSSPQCCSLPGWDVPPALP